MNQTLDTGKEMLRRKFINVYINVVLLSFEKFISLEKSKQYKEVNDTILKEEN